MISLPILNKEEEERALSMLTAECRKIKICPLDNPLYKVAIAALTHSTNPRCCPIPKECEQVDVEDWKAVCKPKSDPEDLSNLASFLGGMVGSLAYRLLKADGEPLKPFSDVEKIGDLVWGDGGSKSNTGPTHKPPLMESEQPNTWKELSRKLTQDCHHPLRPCPMKCSTRQHLYEEHSINLKKRCPFYVLDCDGVTEAMWETELLMAEAKREAMKK